MTIKRLKKTLRLLWKYKSLDYKHLDNIARRQRRRERRKKLIADAGRCSKCGRKDNLTIDHIIPLSKGGSRDSLTNMQVLCFRCNVKKGNKCPGWIYHA